MAAIPKMSSFVQAAEVRLYDPVISVQVISLSDYPIDAPATKKTAVAFVIEFSASSDLREWAHDIDGLIMPKFLSCSENEDEDGWYEPSFIWDSKGVVAFGGKTVNYPNQPLPKSGRYKTVVFPESTSADADQKGSSKDSNNGARGSPNLEDVTEYICMRVGIDGTVGLVKHPWSKPMAISPGLLRDAWEKFKK